MFFFFNKLNNKFFFHSNFFFKHFKTHYSYILNLEDISTLINPQLEISNSIQPLILNRNENYYDISYLENLNKYMFDFNQINDLINSLNYTYLKEIKEINNFF